MLFLLSGLLSVGSVATLAFLIGKAPESCTVTDAGLRVVRPPSKLRIRTATRLPVAQVVPYRSSLARRFKRSAVKNRSGTCVNQRFLRNFHSWRKQRPSVIPKARELFPTPAIAE